MGDSNQKKPRVTLRSYMLWPVIFTLIGLVPALVIFVLSREAGIVALVYVLIMMIVCVVAYIYYSRKLKGALVAYAREYSHVQKELLDELFLPFALTDANGKFLWMNDSMKELVGSQASMLTQVFPDAKDYLHSITEKAREVSDNTEELMVHVDSLISDVGKGHKKYQMVIRRTVFTDPDSALLHEGEGHENNVLLAVYLMDETELLSVKQQLWDDTLVTALIYVDNYDEAFNNVEDVRKSMLAALVERKITKHIENHHGYLCKIEKDKFFAILPQKYFEIMKQDRFSLLEEIKTVNMGNEIAVTISMGLGLEGENYRQNYEYARAAIDMALGRGGDQAVVKSSKGIDYFGGKSHSTEKNTRVRARVKAEALCELIESREQVLIMGHTRSDVDCIGAAIGVYRAAQASKKPAHIVLDNMIPSVKPICERILASPDYEKEVFVNNARARELITDKTILVVVDVNRPSMTECPDLLKKAKCVVVLDHHRQTKEVITGATLSYVEPSASSACEMVAEILQYYNSASPVKVTPLDADAMYAGMVVDTNQFTAKTGVRTFEAAAYLRRCGTEVSRIRKMFREEPSDYLVRAKTVQRTEMFREHFAISICEGNTQEAITVVAAQAANELLDLKNVTAAFVLCKSAETIYISARSIDEVNVQLVMERLGGGGHMNIAGAQIKDAGFDEVVEMLKDTLTQMENNNEI